MRKKMVWCVVLVTVLVSCGQKREVSEVGYTDHAVIDSLFDSPDSLLFPSRGADEELPERADELFDDFIFEFARLKKLQLARVKFPLPSIANGDTTWLTEEQWRYEPLFRGHDYYTVFYNDEEQMDMEKRTDLEVVEVEQIHLEKRLVKVCRFERLGGKWHLTQERLRGFMPGYPLDAFMDFYRKFVSDAVFQQLSVANPLRYVTPDPEDDFNMIEGTLDHSQWDAFKPQLPSGIITNIHYGQTYNNANQMIMVKSGISNGLMDILGFQKRNGAWKLVSYEN